MSNISKNNYWIKLYHEIIHDPKMGRLPDNVWRRCIELFLMAGEMQQDGQLPDFDTIAWELRVKNPEHLEAEMSHLQSVGILTLCEGCWIVTKFAERQAKIADADKQKAYRDRQRVTPTVTETLPVVTQNKNQNKNKDTNSGNSGNNIFTLYENEIGFITQGVTDMLKEDEQLYPFQKIEEAVKIAVEKNVRNWSYIRGILRKWAVNGYQTEKQPAAAFGEPETIELPELSPDEIMIKEFYREAKNSFPAMVYTTHLQPARLIELNGKMILGVSEAALFHLGRGAMPQTLNLVAQNIGVDSIELRQV